MYRAVLIEKHDANEHIGNGIWKVFFRNVFLSCFDESDLRNKQQSTRLATNLVYWLIFNLYKGRPLNEH